MNKARDARDRLIQEAAPALEAAKNVPHGIIDRNTIALEKLKASVAAKLRDDISRLLDRIEASDNVKATIADIRKEIGA